MMTADELNHFVGKTFKGTPVNVIMEFEFGLYEVMDPISKRIITKSDGRIAAVRMTIEDRRVFDIGKTHKMDFGIDYDAQDFAEVAAFLQRYITPPTATTRP